MYNIHNRNLCELCFTELPKNIKKCPHCSGTKNIDKFPSSLPDGTILAGRYCVGKILGKGGFGITYLCYDLKDKKRVAIKEYLPSSLARRNSGSVDVIPYDGELHRQFTDGAQKFYEEAKLISRFNENPNIINVSEFFNENNTTYFVMEYLSGIDMKKYLHMKQTLSEAEALYIAERITDALKTVHSTNTYHRDVSPDNIFLSDSGDVKLIDFGSARQIIANASNNLSVIIKQAYTPIEQYMVKGNQGPWTDIYALGASLYVAITGRTPGNATSRFENPTLDLSGISPEFARIIDKMMAVRPEDRYQDVLTLRADLATLPIVPVPFKTYDSVKSQISHNRCKKCGKQIMSGMTFCKECREIITASHTGKNAAGSNRRLIALISSAALVTAVIILIIILSSKSSDICKEQPYRTFPLVQPSSSIGYLTEK